MNINRIFGLMYKEFIIILKDKGTIAMVVFMPVMMLILFGFAIEFDPKNLPTAIINYDPSPLTRDMISGLQASGYYKIVSDDWNEAAKDKALLTGKISLAVTIPPMFMKKYIRNENPQMLVEIDGSDPGSSASALGNVQTIVNQAISHFQHQDLPPLRRQQLTPGLQIISKKLYNETNRSAFNIVPGLIGVLLTTTLVMLTATAITSEKELGTIEMLLSMPLKPIEIILGKVIPYVILGYLQLTSVLIFGKVLIGIPVLGSLILLYISALPFIIANLMIGMIFSTRVDTPMQAMQMSVFVQLPSIFLSGYVFSFYGMPLWARSIGYLLPMTYFNRITRGILLKGVTWINILPNLIPIIIICLVLIFFTAKLFRTTMD